MHPLITNEISVILESDAVILPGVGAFGDAMESLKKLDIIETLRSCALAGKPFMGICLGMQLMMSESYEFGHHQGLGIFPGKVIRFENPIEGDTGLKVPHVGWNKIYSGSSTMACWSNSLLNGLRDGAFMYFVHSFYVVPEDNALCLATTEYGGIRYCSAIGRGNIFACQFHPERSGREGLKIYQNLYQTLVK
jgi:glutamine amidotransferase